VIAAQPFDCSNASVEHATNELRNRIGIDRTAACVGHREARPADRAGDCLGMKSAIAGVVVFAAARLT
jgi:hypothetical protein